MDDQRADRTSGVNSESKHGCLSGIVGLLVVGGVCTFIAAVPCGVFVAIEYEGGWWIFGLVVGTFAGTGAAFFGIAIVIQKLLGGPPIRLF